MAAQLNNLSIGDQRELSMIELGAGCGWLGMALAAHYPTLIKVPFSNNTFILEFN